MVKVGFIVEGDTEKIIFESESFQNLLIRLNLECVGIFNAMGRGNLNKPNLLISRFFEILKDRSATKVFVVADLEDNPCITKAKEELHVFSSTIQTTIVVVKAIESWFLADVAALSVMLRSRIQIKEPENSKDKPFDRLNQLFTRHINRGIGNKKVFAKQILRYGFSVENAANNPKCKSAQYFIRKLTELNS